MSDKKPEEAGWKLLSSGSLLATEAGVPAKIAHASTARSSRQQQESSSNSSSCVKPKRAREFHVAESKLQNYDNDNEFEQIYSAILQDLRRRRDRNGSLAFMELSKAQYKDELGLPLAIFNSLWSKVVEKLDRDAARSENTDENSKPAFDWTCLLIGPNFNPDYDFSIGEIREEF